MVLAFIFLNCITIALERPQIEAGSTVSGCSTRGWAEGQIITMVGRVQGELSQARHLACRKRETEIERKNMFDGVQ